jgi:uncharacterized protein HemX
MAAWLKGVWAKTGLWVKLAGLAILATLGYIGYLQLKRRGLEKEAEDLRRQNTIKEAEVKVAYLEGLKQRNQARLDQIPGEEARIDQRIRDERKRLEEAKARVAGMTDDQIAARLREFGL